MNLKLPGFFVIFFDHNDQVFSFLYPNKDQEGQYFEFTNIDSLVKFIQANPIINPEHHVVLSIRAQTELSKIMDKFKYTATLVKDLMNQINLVYTPNGQDIDSLTQMSNSLLSIQKSLETIQTPIEFVTSVEKIVKNKTIESLLKKIRLYHNFYAFIDNGLETNFLQNVSQIIKRIIDDEVNKVVSLIHEKKTCK